MLLFSSFTTKKVHQQRLGHNIISGCEIELTGDSVFEDLVHDKNI